MSTGTLRGGPGGPPRRVGAPPLRMSAIIGFFGQSSTQERQITPSFPGDAHTAGVGPPRAYPLWYENDVNTGEPSCEHSEGRGWGGTPHRGTSTGYATGNNDGI